MGRRTPQAVALVVLAMAAANFSPAPTSAMFHSAPVSRHERTFLKAWEAVKDNYYDRKKISNWDQWKNKFHGKLASERDLQRALDTMVDSLGDDYTFVLTEKDMDTRSAKQKEKCISAARMLPNQVGYIKLDNFSSDSISSEMKSALKKLASAQGVLLDLRGNHGGFVTAAHDLFSMLADEGKFMSYQGYMDGEKDDETFVLKKKNWEVVKNGKVTTEHRHPNMIGNKPMVVLVDDDTRSAAEMLSGALRDNGRAVVVGEKTYGKGVLQDTFEVGENFAVKVVTARYFLPDGTNIHEKGINPDIEIGGEPDAQLQRAAHMLASAIAQARSTGRRVIAVIEQNGASL